MRFRSFTINDEVFELGDFAVVKPKNSASNKICRILTMYESNQKWHEGARYRGIVRWYTWATELERKCNPHFIEFDKKSEVSTIFDNIALLLKNVKLNRLLKIIVVWIFLYH